MARKRSLVALLEAVAAELRKDNLTVILEQSPVGESQSNGVAERQLQAVEDLLRTMRGALMHRLQCRITATHLIFQWLVMHVASVMNRYVVGGDGRTAFQRLHGRRASSKAVEFGERVFYYIPKKLRAKMSLRWRLGMYLGVASHSGEHLIGTWSGDVVRTRSIVRTVESARWSSELADRLKGVPAYPVPSGNNAYENVEKNEDPHAMADFEQVDKKDKEFADKTRRRIRITKADLDKYGFTSGCPRCADLQSGARDSTHNHSEDCRFRIYGEWEAKSDPKWILLSRQLESEYPKDEVREGEVDAEGHQRLPEVLAEESRDLEVLPGSVHRPDEPVDPHRGEPMDEEGTSDHEPMVDVDHGISPATPTGEQMSDMVIDGLVLAGVSDARVTIKAGAPAR